MTTIKLDDGATTDRAMRTVRETFEARDYHWEQDDAEHAVASEGGRPVHGASLPVAQRVRVSIVMNTRKSRLELSLESTGAAYSAAGAGWFHVQLASRYRAMVRAVREDLAAAALR